MISTPETAATRTSKVDSIIPQSRIGNMSLLGPDKNRETGTLSTEAINAIKVPAAIPGKITGKVIRLKV